MVDVLETRFDFIKGGVGGGREQDTIANFHIRCCEMPRLPHAINIHYTFVVSKVPSPGMRLARYS